jgi:hypothetical protein
MGLLREEYNSDDGTANQIGDAKNPQSQCPPPRPLTAFLEKVGTKDQFGKERRARLSIRDHQDREYGSYQPNWNESDYQPLDVLEAEHWVPRAGSVLAVCC